MATPSNPPAPIVSVAAALIIGAACGGERVPPEAAVLAAGLVLVLAAFARRRPGIAVPLVAAAAFALGAAAQGQAWRDSGRRLDAAFGRCAVRELELVGRLAGAPERDRDGGLALRVETASEGVLPPLRLRLDVVEVPGEDRDRVESLRAGDVVRVWCRLRAPVAGPGISETEARRRLAAQRLDATGRVKNSRLVRCVAAGRWSPARSIDAARVRARDALDRAVGTSGETRAILGAMVLGDRLLLDPDTNALLRDAGLVHILSISGLHTSLSVLLALGMLRRTGLGARGLFVAGGALLLAFSAFVGHGASVWRACAGLGVGLLARVVGRDPDPLAALALAAALLVIAVPTLAFSAGFLLSVVATAGLVTATQRKARGRDTSSFWSRSMAASLGAYLATAPLLAGIFGRLAPVALVSNLLAAPLCAACLAAGAAAAALDSVPVAGAVAAAFAKACTLSLLYVSHAATGVPGGHLRVAPPSAALVTAYVVLLLALALGRGGRAARLVFGLCVIALHLGPPPPGPGPSRAEDLDVGQGLAVILRGPEGRFALVDAGPAGGGRFDAGDLIVVPALAARGCRRLEILALSHDHEDHAGGARAVLRDVEVGELWLGEGSHLDPVTGALAAEALARGVAVRRLKRGDQAIRGGLAFRALHPGDGDRSRPLNDRCLALQMRAPEGATLLLPGDLEAGGEAALLSAGADPGSGALVAPHHGADGSSTLPFLARTGPSLVLVSAGAGNRFRHPGKGALSRFAAIGARVFRTDLDGTIALDAEGGAWRVSVEKDRRGDERQDENERECERERETSGP